MGMKNAIIILSALALLVASHYAVYRYAERRTLASISEKTDTMWITHTVHVPSPAPIAQRVLDTRIFFVAVPAPAASDTATAGTDSCYVELPVEQKEYGDSTYHAWVSGFRPQLDSIVLFQKTQIITTTVTQKAPRFGFAVTAGLAAGYFITPAGWQVGAGPAVSVGFYWKF